MTYELCGITRKGLTLVLTMSLALAGAAATDGTPAANITTLTWGALNHWAYGVKPSSDGTATFPFRTKTVNLATDESINRIELPGRGPDRAATTPTNDIAFAGSGSLTFTGTDGGINFEDTVVFPHVGNSAQLTFSPATVGIPSGVTATFGGGGVFTLTDVTGSGTLKLTDNNLTITHPTPSFTGTVDLDGGDFNFSPTAAGSLSIGTLARSLSGIVRANGTSGKAATLTIGKLGTRENRAMLVVGAGSKRRIGTDDKVFVTDASAVPVHDGIVDPVIFGLGERLSFNNWDDFRADFLTYDETDGFKVYTPNKTLAEASATEIASVSNSVSATTKTVKGLMIEYAKQLLTVPEGVTLTIGDGTNPAAILINATRTSSGSVWDQIGGGGTIAFGGSEGIIATACGHFGSHFGISPTITGSNGVTFMSAVNRPSSFYLNKAAGWTGPTHIWNERLVIGKSGLLPSGGDVYVDGDKGQYAGMLHFTDTFSLNQKFHLRGWGAQKAGYTPSGVLYVQDGKTVTFTGSIELTDDAEFNAGYSKSLTVPDQSGKMVFNCPVTGTGLLTLAGANYAFNSAGSVSGIDGISLRGNGKLTATGADFSKAGAFTADVDTQADFRLMTNTTFSGGVQSEGYVRFVTGTNTLVGVSSIGTLALEGGAVVSVDGHLTAGVAETAMMDGNAKIVAAKGKASVFEVNATNDQSLAIHVEDGAGTLDFVKSGTGTLKLGGTLAYTGKTVVKEGTLTFAKSILDDPGISWWFDATNAAAMTKNASGKVMSVPSKVGSTRLVNWEDTLTGPTVANKLNGLDVFTFSHADDDGFKTDRETCQRTVFLVQMTRTNYTIMGLYGDYADRGIRATTSSTSPFYWTKGGYIGNLRANGSTASWRIQYEVGKPQIAQLDQRSDDDYGSDKFYSHYRAYVGNYYPYHGRGFDGDIAEAIAFNRNLSDEESLQVSKYLSDRWNIELSRQPAGTATPARPLAASALEIADGATLDLAGCDLTVASLAGAGAIVNTGATAAKLIVTGACTFRGTVGAGVTLKAAGSLDVAVAAGGGLDLAAGTTTLGKNYFTPMTNDLALWLDASRVETITTNASGAAKGRVTEWRSLAGRMSGVVSGIGRVSSQQWGPLYGADSDGKPACCFDHSNNLACVKMAPRTVIIAGKNRTLPGNYVALWGLYKLDCEWRTGNGNYTLGSTGFSSGTCTLTIEHADGTSSCKLAADDRILAVARAPDGVLAAASHDTHFIDGPDRVNCSGFSLGANFNSGLNQDVNEVIVYERYLTDDELAPILEYLRDKWIRSSGSTVGRQPAPVLAEGSTLAFSGGTTDLSALGTLSVSTLANNGAGGTLTGDVTVTDTFTFDAQGATTVSPLVIGGNLTLGADAKAEVLGQHNLPQYVFIPALRAMGVWTGSFSSATFEEPSRNWRALRKDTDWGIRYSKRGFMILLD